MPVAATLRRRFQRWCLKQTAPRRLRLTRPLPLFLHIAPGRRSTSELQAPSGFSVWEHSPHQQTPGGGGGGGA